LPERWPQLDGCDLSFLFQIYCDQEKLVLPNTLCLQGYQLMEGHDYISDIIIVQVRHGAVKNFENVGGASEYPEGDILFEEVAEEDSMEENFKKNIHTHTSKLLGWYPKEEFHSDDIFLGCLGDEDPFTIGCNYKCCLIADGSGRVKTVFI